MNCFHPREPDKLTHGWRWYSVNEHNQIASPIVGDLLPRSGVLENVYFIPSAVQMSCLVPKITLHHEKSPDVLTYGRVYGPFEYDHTMPTWGSMKCARYEATFICTTDPAKLVGAYEVPIVQTMELAEMEFIERTWGSPGVLVLNPRDLARSVDRPLRVVFVCTGNLCRSPIAEIVFAQQIRHRGLGDAVRVSSAGTHAWHSRADPRTVSTLRAHNLPATPTPTQLAAEHLSADLLVAMDRSHLAWLRSAGVPDDRMCLLRAFDPLATFSGAPDVANPYNGTLADFEHTCSTIADALPGLHCWVDHTLARDAPAHVATATRGRTAAHP